MISTYRKLSNLGKCPPSHFEGADPCKRMLLWLVRTFLGYIIIFGLRWFDSPWLNWCSGVMKTKSFNYFNSNLRNLRNCVAGNLSGRQAASNVSVWESGFCQNLLFLPPQTLTRLTLLIRGARCHGGKRKGMDCWIQCKSERRFSLWLLSCPACQCWNSSSWNS